MKLNYALRGILLTLPILGVTSCSVNKKASDDQSGMIVNTEIKKDKSNNLYAEEQAQLKIQELKKDNTIYFDLDKYDITADYTHILDEHATLLRNNASYKVTIEGHTDERGTPEYNIALGERRAYSVKNYLQSKGVLADQISIVSYGKEKPAVLNHDSAAYAKNRRAILIY